MKSATYNCVIYFTSNVLLFIRKSFVTGTPSAIKDLGRCYGWLFEKGKFVNIHGIRVMLTKSWSNLSQHYSFKISWFT
jgi:hypothetical protein